MPIIKSAKKRVRVARKATVRNSKTKRNLRTALKAFHATLTGGVKPAEAHSKAQSALDKAGKHGILHKNKVARKKRQLAAATKVAGIKPVGASKKSAPKAQVKKAVVKKAVAKKTVKK